MSPVPTTRRAVLGAAGALGLASIPGVRRRQVGPEAVTGCTVLDQPGRYVLESDLDASGWDVDEDVPCIRITADDVVLDGQGHSIRRLRGLAIGVFGDDATIQNLDLDGTYYGVDFTDTSGGAIRSVTVDAESCVRLLRATDLLVEDCLFDSLFYCVRLRDCTDTVFRRNTFDGERGLFLRNSHRNVATDNVFTRSLYEGILLSDSDDNLLARNRVTGTDLKGINVVRGRDNVLYRNEVSESYDRDGVYVIDSTGTVVARNTFRDNFRSGLRLTRSDDGLVVRNTATGNGRDGITLNDADNNEVLENVLCGNGADPIDLIGGSSGNLVRDNDTSC